MTLGSKKGGEFLKYLIIYKLFKKDSTPWTYVENVIKTEFVSRR
jgi:hypothetical protein